jgi:methionine sulfoxide reductase catalytic subunit
MTDSVKIERRPHDPIASTLSAADDRIVMNEWLPPQEGIVPCIRVGRRWISILWTVPIGAVALVLAIAVAQSMRELQGVQAFIRDYPGIAQSAPSVDSGFPWWLQLQHFLNMLFMSKRPVPTAPG